MKHSVVVKTMPSKEGGWLILSHIKYEGKEWMITKSGECVAQDSTKKALTKRVTPIETWPFDYDDKEDALRTSKKLMSALIMHHHQVFAAGFKNPNSGSAVIFEFEDLSQKNIDDYKNLSYLTSALNKAKELSYREKVDAIYFYGGNPIGRDNKLKTHREVFLQLCHPKNGIVVQDIPYAGKTFLQHFVDNYKKGDSEYTLKTTILKGLSLGLLKREGTAIVFGESIIGSNIEESVTWLKNNAERNKYLIKEISQKDVLDVDDIDAAVLESEGGNQSAEDLLKKKASHKEVRDRAELMGISNYHNALIDNLLPKVESAEAQWEEAKKYNIDFVPKMKPEVVKGLIDKAKEKELV